MIEITCERCGGKRKFFPSDLLRGRGRFCSKKCHDEWLSEYSKDNAGEKHPRYIKKETRYCKVCGDEFKCHPVSKKILCGPNCAAQNIRNIYKGKHHTTFKGGAYEAVKRYAAKNKGKVAVWVKLNRAVKDGRINKGRCVVCGSKKVVGHHENYAKPLKVTWLCQKHHVHLHKGIIKI
jgi:hypothetical protein